MQTKIPAPTPVIKENLSNTESTLRRIRGEFLEMPGLRLTEAQARRLWALDAPTCAAMLDTLIVAGFLFRTSDGAFMRLEQQLPLQVRPSLRTARVPAA
jgi:hypothetical protein